MNLQHRNNCILFSFHPDRKDAFGFFDEDEREIYISDKLNLLTRECVYFHELTHKECFLNKCKCWEGNSIYWCEYHALRGEFLKARATGSIRIRQAYLKNVTRAIAKYKRNVKIWGSHLGAMQRLMRTKMYKEFIHQGVK